MFPPTLLQRTVLRIGGPDARDFLDNLITQDVGLLDRQKVIYAGLLTPQGKVLADFFLWRDGEGFVLEADPVRGPGLAQRLAMYRLRAKVEIADISTTAGVLLSTEQGEEDPRLAALGKRALVATGPAGDGSGYRSHRIGLGIPDLATEAEADEVFALEALFEELNGVAFDKGCFVGQENVSRMKRRATTRKKFCRLRVADGAETGPVFAQGVEIGSVRAASGETALALIRLDRAMERRDALTIGKRAALLTPPDWLILPQAEKA